MNIAELTSKEFLTPKEVETLYGFKRCTQAKWRMKGDMPYIKLGRIIMYNHQKLKKWLESKTAVSLDQALKNRKKEAV